MNASDLNDLRARLAPTLDVLDAERARQLNVCKIGAIWSAALGALGALIVAGLGNGISIWMLAPLFLAIIAYSIVTNNAKNSYGQGFKHIVTPQLVKHFGDLSYSPQFGLSESEFNLANLFQNPDRYSSEDLIEGKVGATRLQMSEIHAEDKQTRTDSKGRTTTTYTTIFRGLFVIADFNKNFNGFTYVLPEGISGSLGSFGRGIQSLGGKLGGRGELVQLEDPEFEQNFVVYSHDQIEARYLLSSALMLRLLELKRQFNGNVSVAFIAGSMYLMISKYENWFEPPALSAPLTFESVETTLRQLQMATGIVEELDLNTRIWSKQ